MKNIVKYVREKNPQKLETWANSWHVLNFLTKYSVHQLSSLPKFTLPCLLCRKSTEKTLFEIEWSGYTPPPWILKWGGLESSGGILISWNSKFLILATCLTWRRLPAEIAARWRCRLPIKNLTPYYSRQFCVSFHCWMDQEDSDS